MSREGQFDSFLKEISDDLGADIVNRSNETILRYGENTMALGDRPPWGVLYPKSTTDVQKIVKAAIRHGIPLYPTSTGANIGLGTRSANTAGMVVVDLGRNMNRIIEIDERLGYAVVEPGVSFQMLYDELVRRGDKLMVSITSGPPHGGIMGNALDKGAGYSPYFDHFGFSCGMEIVLGTGEILRTGDGSLNVDNLMNWHTSKYSFGPTLDGLFAQSNFGIVTRIGMWLMPRPPAVRSFHFTFPDDDDLEQIIELARPMKMSNFVPSLFRISNDLYLSGTESESPEYALSNGKKSISDDARKELQKQYGVGSWTISGAFYGLSHEAMEPQIQRVIDHFGQSSKATYIPHEAALANPPLETAIKAFSCIPWSGELGLLKWRPGGGNTWFTPGTPMDGRLANDLQILCRGIYEKYGMDYMVMNVGGARFARGLHVLAFNREDEDEAARADACYREMSEKVAERGIFVGRAPIDYHDMHMSQTIDGFQNVCSAIKKGLDPHGILAPGRYGIY